MRAVALESFWVCRECGVQGVGTLLEQGLSLAVVDRRRGHVADAGMAMAVVVPREELLTMGARVFDAAKALREVGTVLEGLELRLGEGVVVPDGRLWDLVTSRSTNSSVTVLERMLVPRSACSVSTPGATFCLATVSAINCSASCALSRGAIIQPTT